MMKLLFLNMFQIIKYCSITNSIGGCDMVKSKKHLFFILCIIILGIIFSFNDISYASYTSEMIFYEIDNNEVTITAGGNSKDVNIPNYIEDYPVTKISYRAFCLNPYYTSITLPETLITIEKEAIISCENIREITIPKNVQNIDSYALGYELNFNYNIEKVEYTYNKMKDFIIKGYKGTVAETYANENGFKLNQLKHRQSLFSLQKLLKQQFWKQLRQQKQRLRKLLRSQQKQHLQKQLRQRKQQMQHQVLLLRKQLYQ